MKYNNRLEFIIKLLEAQIEMGIAEIVHKTEEGLGKKVPKITINRDLEKLIVEQLIERIGKGPAVRYKLSSKYKLFHEISVEQYFNDNNKDRAMVKNFNFDIFNALETAVIFDDSEEKNLSELNQRFLNNMKDLSSDIVRRELERLTIELSWKSSRLEGNTYSLLETENLIKNHQEASGHTKEEALMILNHKEALDYIDKNRKNFQKINVSKTEDVHYLLTKGLGIDRNIRKRMVGITGTNYAPLNNEFQIKEALEKACEIVNEKTGVFSKVLLLNLLIAYIQPFNDGNKRTSRLMGNAVLMAHDACPLSFRSIDELEYKKAMILFYEQNNLRYFKELFIEQFKFSVENYFLA